MKLEIVRKLNLSILDYEIKQVGREKINYILMNSDTQKTLASSGVTVSYMANAEHYCTKYNDIPIAIFEGLKYGQMEIVKTVEEEKK